MSDWARDYFERGYAQRWGLAPVSDQVRRQARSLCDLLQLDPGSSMVDIACGHGRHGIALAELGHHVVGVDFAQGLLLRARQLCPDLDLPVRWIRADMRQLPLRSGFAQAAIVADSFGFFETDAENEAVLFEAARILGPNGRIALKVVNAAPILADFRATNHEERDGLILKISRRLEESPPRLTERIRVTGHGSSSEYMRRQRLYRSDELRDALQRKGFSTMGVFATSDGARFDAAKSTTMWIIGRRAGAS